MPNGDCLILTAGCRPSTGCSDHNRLVDVVAQSSATAQVPRVEQYLEDEDGELNERCTGRQVRFDAVRACFQLDGNPNRVTSAGHRDVGAMSEVCDVDVNAWWDDQPGRPSHVDGAAADSCDTEQRGPTVTHGKYNNRSLGLLAHWMDTDHTQERTVQCVRHPGEPGPSSRTVGGCKPGQRGTPRATSRRAIVDRSGHARPASTLRMVTWLTPAAAPTERMLRVSMPSRSRKTNRLAISAYGSADGVSGQGSGVNSTGVALGVRLISPAYGFRRSSTGYAVPAIRTVILLTMTLGNGSRPYQPRMEPERWVMIAPYVHDVVARAEPLVTYDARELYPAVTRLVEFAHNLHMPLEDRTAFDPFTVERFAQFHLATYNRASRNSMRARLRRVSEALLGETAAVQTRALGKAAASRPYSARDIADLDGWAQAQPSEERRTSARALLALGLGAGLTGAEIIALRRGDVIVGETTDVSVAGAVPRVVPMVSDWADELSDRLTYLGTDGWVFHSEQRGGNINLITDFISRTGPHVPLQTRRMRATWLIHHLETGTPLKTLLRIAGLQSAEALDRVLPFVNET